MFLQLAMVSAVVAAGGQALAVEPVEHLMGASRFDNQISINPLNLLYNEVSLNYERRLTPGLSVYATPSFTIAKMGPVSETATLMDIHFGLGRLQGSGSVPAVRLQGTSNRTHDQLGIDAGARFYVRGDSLSGLFLTPSIGYRHQFRGSKGNPAERFNVSGKIGYQWFPGDVVAVAISGGLTYGVSYVDKVVSDGFRPDFQASIGVPF